MQERRKTCRNMMKIDYNLIKKKYLWENEKRHLSPNISIVRFTNYMSFRLKINLIMCLKGLHLLSSNLKTVLKP